MIAIKSFVSPHQEKRAWSVSCCIHGQRNVDVIEDMANGKESVEYGEDGLAITSIEPNKPKLLMIKNQPVFGPRSLGVDISFYSSQQLLQLYGHPAQRDRFRGIHNGGIVSDQYQLYNLDVFGYELDVPMAFYGSIPLLTAAQTFNSFGAFWYDLSKTFVDVITDANRRKKSHWMSESGVLYVFFLIGPLPPSFSKQYVSLTAIASTLPPVLNSGTISVAGTIEMSVTLIKEKPALIHKSHHFSPDPSVSVPFAMAIMQVKRKYLKYTTKMLLSMSIAGLTFVGADIGGFFGNPDTELLTRWYQAAAYQPFLRGHAHHDSDRREPWVFGEPHIRSAIRERYSLLPQLYTLFYICSTQGLPIIRLLWYHFDSDEILHQEDAFLLGSDLLIHPVYKPIVGQGKLHDGIPAPIEHIPIFQRGGSIVTRKRRVRRSSALMHHDPVSLLITLDATVSAKGQLYLDDERTFAYKVSNRFTLVHLECPMNGLQSFVSANGYASSVWVERIEIYGFGALYKVPTNVLREFEAVSAVISAKTNTKEDDMESGVSYRPLDFTYDLDLDQLIVRKPALKLHEVWKLQFRYGDR
ncbi:unnamed protein product [Albugo candida]|uniref:Uncharacterized protein n=2 Tax=Albugo candida TaxID=65357 RepID=A0A024GTK6_9STRA|nr:unnamed protein product [Albugo candida]|eukprot:CCI49901.1 unnamed protein product [Albugo candida]